MKYLFSIILLFLIACFGAEAQGDSLPITSDNPFVDMAGKPYKEYSERIRFLYDDMAYTDSAARFSLLEQLKKTARQSGDRNLELEARLWETQYRQSETYGLKVPYSVEDAIRDRIEIAEIARKENRPHIHIKALQLIVEAYRLYLKNYDLTFEYLQQMSRALETVSVDEMPEKLRYLLDIGNFYFWFQDYKRAERYYSEIIKTPEVADRQSSLRAAYNGLGLIFRNNDNLSASDSMFRAILNALSHTSKKPEHLDVWVGVATGNLGNNAYLRGEYDTALSMLAFSRDKMLEHNDYDYASGMAITLADIYLKKNDIPAAKRQIDFAQENLPKAFKSNKYRMLYPVLAKYYAATGNPYLAGQYVDSTLISNENHNEEFHTVRLLHAEQRLHREEMNTEQVRSEGYRRVAVTVSVTLIIVSLLLFVIVYFYRKKRKAYRELVRHSQSWAGVDVSEVSEITGDPSGMENGIVEADTGTDVITAKPVAPEESDKIIMQSIEKAMSEKKLYKCSDLSLDSLAAETGFSRYYVSQALNRCAGKNFSSYVNDYRIKEAIRIMSEPSNGNLTLDGIAYESGFNDRQNFHRVFKKKTGLPPGDFRKNMNRK